jgi:transposase InsO family protein
VWRPDITYVETDEVWQYVAPAAASAGLCPAHQLAAGCVVDGNDPTTVTARLLHYSNRGVQYFLQAKPERCGVVGSMSLRGNCYYNAAMKSFRSALRRDPVYRRHFAARGEARAAIFESFITSCGSTAPQAAYPLWALKLN